MTQASTTVFFVLYALASVSIGKNRVAIIQE